MLVTSGVTADLDFASYFGGPETFLKYHHAVLHSILGCAVMCGVIAALFCMADRSGRAKENTDSGAARLGFAAAYCVCVVGAGVHVVLDLASGAGVRLLWPFRASWQSWDLLTNLDVWILILLVAGLLLPQLARIVSEEIGERKPDAPGRLAAVVTLILLGLYIGARGMLHSRATDLLRSRDYHGQPPQNAGAFPASSNPFAWRGLVSTVGAIDEINILLLPGATFDPERALSHYKPEESATIAAAQKTAEASLFLTYARFPLATVEPLDPGFDVTIRDLRFPAGDGSLDNMVADVEVDANFQITAQRIRYARASRR